MRLFRHAVNVAIAVLVVEGAFSLADARRARADSGDAAECALACEDCRSACRGVAGCERSCRAEAAGCCAAADRRPPQLGTCWCREAAR